MEGLQHAYEHAGIKGAAMAAVPLAVAYGLNKLRASGLSKEQAMFRDALLNPEIGRLYMTKVKPGDDAGRLTPLVGAVRRSIITAPIIKEAAQSSQQ